jgi:hypothetical protein
MVQQEEQEHHLSLEEQVFLLQQNLVLEMDLVD